MSREPQKRECPALLDAANLRIYKENAFRVTGLATTAGVKEIARHSDKMKLLEEMGGTMPTSGAFPLNPPPNIDEVRAAFQRLKEPEHRIVDEFFWFWTRGEGAQSDPAMEALARGDSQGAYEIWIEEEKFSPDSHISIHNLAIMFHLIALDWTNYQLVDEVDSEREEKIKGYWQASLERWEKITDDDRIWDHVKLRIRELDDPRIASGFARRMAENLPLALDKINAEAALRYAEDTGRTDLAKLHIDFMHQTHQGSDDVVQTMETVLRPLKNRVNQRIESARQAVGKFPEKGADIAEEMIHACIPLQRIYELFYGQEGFEKTELFDEVALAGVDCVVAFQKTTADDARFVEVLGYCLPLASSLDVRERIQKNISIGRNNDVHKELEPWYTQLKDIMERVIDPAQKLQLLKTLLLPKFYELQKSKDRPDNLINEMADALSIALRLISIDANNVYKNENLATEAIRLALDLVSSPEIEGRLLADLSVILNNIKINAANAMNAVNRTRGNGCLVVLSGLLSFVLPGLGQLIQGRIQAAAIQFTSAAALWCVFMGWIVHLYSFCDAQQYKKPI